MVFENLLENRICKGHTQEKTIPVSSVYADAKQHRARSIDTPFNNRYALGHVPSTCAFYFCCFGEARQDIKLRHVENKAVPMPFVCMVARALPKTSTPKKIQHVQCASTFCSFKLWFAVHFVKVRHAANATVPMRFVQSVLGGGEGENES